MSAETVYLGHDNSIDLILKADGVAISLAAVTAMTITFGTKKVESDNGDADPIRWNKPGYATGEVRLFLGAEVITPGLYVAAPLIVYDASNDDGVVWTTIGINVVAEVEGT